MMKALAAGGRTFPASVGSVVAVWDASDLALADGDPVGSWVDRVNGHTLTASGSARPTFAASANRVGARPAITFDGSSDVLAVGSNLTTSTSGVVIVLGEITDGIAWSSADVNASNPHYYYMFGGRFSGLLRMQSAATSVGGTAGIGLVTVSETGPAVWEWASSGFASGGYSIRKNNTPLTLSPLFAGNNGRWFGDVANRDNFTVGAQVASAGNGGTNTFMAGWISAVIVLNAIPAEGPRSDLYRWLLG